MHTFGFSRLQKGLISSCLLSSQGRERPRSSCPGQVNFALGQVKIDVWWLSGPQ